MDDYEWDVFISYRRFNKWKTWIDKHFKPLLHEALQPELRKTDVKIFVDENSINKGAHWPNALRAALARSRVIVPLICAGYWDSDWCKRELAIMMEREQICGLQDRNAYGGLVIPVIIHDGERRPDPVLEIQSFEANRSHVRTHLSSKAGLELFVNDVAEQIAKNHQDSPDFRDTWQAITGDEFFGQLGPKDDVRSMPRLV